MVMGELSSALILRWDAVLAVAILAQTPRRHPLECPTERRNHLKQ
jgi:hypothetical protein